MTIEKNLTLPDNLDDLVSAKGITHILLAIPSVSRYKRNKILKKISKNNLIIRSVPSLIDLANGHVTFSDLRDYEISDLLEREIVSPNHEMLIKNVNLKNVLVTGAGGSIGGELCRQIINLNPAKLILLEHNEFSLYKIQHHLDTNYLVLPPNDIVLQTISIYQHQSYELLLIASSHLHFEDSYL